MHAKAYIAYTLVPIHCIQTLLISLPALCFVLQETAKLKIRRCLLHRPLVPLHKAYTAPRPALFTLALLPKVV